MPREEVEVERRAPAAALKSLSSECCEWASTKGDAGAGQWSCRRLSSGGGCCQGVEVAVGVRKVVVRGVRDIGCAREDCEETYCRIQAGCFTALRGARAKTRPNNGARGHFSIITVCVDNCAASGDEGHIAQHENHPAKLHQRDVDRSRGEETRGDKWHWRLAPPASSEACPARPCLEDALEAALEPGLRVLSGLLSTCWTTRISTVAVLHDTGDLAKQRQLCGRRSHRVPIVTGPDSRREQHPSEGGHGMHSAADSESHHPAPAPRLFANPPRATLCPSHCPSAPPHDRGLGHHPESKRSLVAIGRCEAGGCIQRSLDREKTVREGGSFISWLQSLQKDHHRQQPSLQSKAHYYTGSLCASLTTALPLNCAITSFCSLRRHLTRSLIIDKKRKCFNGHGLT